MTWSDGVPVGAEPLFEHGVVHILIWLSICTTTSYEHGVVHTLIWLNTHHLMVVVMKHDVYAAEFCD